MKCAYTAGPLGCGDDAMDGSNYCAVHRERVTEDVMGRCITQGCGVKRHGESLYCLRHLDAVRKTVRALNANVEKRRVRRGTIALAVMAALGAGVALLAVALLPEPQAMVELQRENTRLKHALELFTRNEGSCAVQNNGPRVLCGMRDGYVARRELDDNDQVVTGPAMRGPLKRKRVK